LAYVLSGLLTCVFSVVPFRLFFLGRVSCLVALGKLLAPCAYVSVLYTFRPLGLAALRQVHGLPLSLRLRRLCLLLMLLLALFERGQHHLERLVAVRLYLCWRNQVWVPVFLAVVPPVPPLCSLRSLSEGCQPPLIGPLVHLLGLHLLLAKG
jgi:hypothetical protein